MVREVRGLHDQRWGQVWRKLLEAIQNMPEDRTFEETAEELQDKMCDQLSQYTTGELLSDLHLASPAMSLQSNSRAFAFERACTAPGTGNLGVDARLGGQVQ